MKRKATSAPKERKAPQLPNPFDEVLLQQARRAVRSLKRKGRGK